MHKTLRQRIRKTGISPKPWKHYKGEIRLLPVSAQTLFRNSGLSWDTLEMELKSEGWLLPDENLWNILSDYKELMRQKEYIDSEEPWDDSWTEDDFKAFYANLGK